MKSQKPVLNKLFANISYPFCHSKRIRFNFWRFASPKRVINFTWVWFSFKWFDLLSSQHAVALKRLRKSTRHRTANSLHTHDWLIYRTIAVRIFSIHLSLKISPTCLPVLDCCEKPHAKSSLKVGQQKLSLEVITNNLWILFGLAYYAVAINGTITCKLPRNWLISGVRCAVAWSFDQFILKCFNIHVILHIQCNKEITAYYKSLPSTVHFLFSECNSVAFKNFDTSFQTAIHDSVKLIEQATSEQSLFSNWTKKALVRSATNISLRILGYEKKHVNYRALKTCLRNFHKVEWQLAIAWMAEMKSACWWIVKIIHLDTPLDIVARCHGLKRRSQ